MERPYFNLTDNEVKQCASLFFEELFNRNLTAHDILRTADVLAQTVYERHPEVTSDRSGYWRVADLNNPLTYLCGDKLIGRIVVIRFEVGDGDDHFPGWVCGHDPINNTYQVKYKSKVMNDKGEYYAFEQYEDCTPMCVRFGMLRAAREGYPPTIDCPNPTVAPAIYKRLYL